MLTTVDLSRIVCADWSKNPVHRSVYFASMSARVIDRLTPTKGRFWSFSHLCEMARTYQKDGPVLLGIDVPLGAPASLLAGHRDFASWLWTTRRRCPDFFEPCTQIGEWSPARPFFRVPKGGLRRWLASMDSRGIDPFREIDTATGAKPLLIVSGIAGSVGSSVCDVWPQLPAIKDLRLWPFDGLLEPLIRRGSPTLGEIYPRALYGIALSDQPIDRRRRLRINKSDHATRSAALLRLVRHPWVETFGVEIKGVQEATSNDDDFDALFSAAALMRCALEGSSLESTLRDSREGGMLGSLSLNIYLPEETFLGADIPLRRTHAAPRPSDSDSPAGVRCPIANCTKLFMSGRGGWDAHVASTRTHHGWHPDERDPKRRKRLFLDEYPDFFARRA